MVTALFWEAKLNLIKFLNSSTDGAPLPPTAGIGLFTLILSLTFFFAVESFPLTITFVVPNPLILLTPKLLAGPPPTLYLMNSVVDGVGISPNDRLLMKLPILSTCPWQPTKSFNDDVSSSPPPNIILQNSLSVNSFTTLFG